MTTATIPTLTGPSSTADRRGVAVLQERVPGQAAIEHLVLTGEPRRPRSVVGRTLGFDPLDATARAPFDRAIGARAVAQRLAELPSGWSVMHSLPIGRRSAVDHVLIGPSGVFAITAVVRRLPSAARVDADLRRVAELVADCAVDGGPTVRALVVVTSPRPLLAHRVGLSHVVRCDRLRAQLTALPARYEPDEVARIVRSLEGVDRWSTTPVAEPELLRRFSGLQRQVAAARRLRHGWQVAGVVGVVSALILLAR